MSNVRVDKFVLYGADRYARLVYMEGCEMGIAMTATWLLWMGWTAARAIHQERLEWERRRVSEGVRHVWRSGSRLERDKWVGRVNVSRRSYRVSDGQIKRFHLIYVPA